MSRRYESKILIIDYLLSNSILNRLLRLVKICQALAWAFLNNLLSLSKRLNCLVLCFNFSLNLFHFCEIAGILDQGSGVLVVFDETPVDKTYENTLELIHEMGKVVDALYSKAKKLQ